MGIFDESIGTFLAPVRAFLEDETVSEVLINGPHEIFVERRGLLEKTDARFGDEQALIAAVRNIAQFVGRKIDAEHLTLDARLPDGSRIAAVVPPCSRKGTTLSIRKFSKSSVTFGDLIQRGSVSKEAARFLDICVFLGKNMIVSGGTGSGKTTLLNVLGGRIPKTQRLLIIEDSSELKIAAEHAVYFETKHANAEGKGEVTIRDLLRSALRLRPDRIVVGEVRGGEAMDLINAMNTGHGGSMGTVHANGPSEAMIRLETLAMMNDGNMPTQAIRMQIASAVQVIVQIKRLADGSRRLTHISELMTDLDASGKYVIKDLFRFVQQGRDAQGKIVGAMLPVGNIPTFMQDIEVNRLPFGRELFAAPQSTKKAA